MKKLTLITVILLICFVVIPFAYAECFLETAADSVADFLSNDCDDEMDDVIHKYGDVAEVDKYEDGDYHSVTYWYWCQGVSFTFTWSSDISCEKSKYTFSPICY